MPLGPNRPLLAEATCTLDLCLPLRPARPFDKARHAVNIRMEAQIYVQPYNMYVMCPLYVSQHLSKAHMLHTRAVCMQVQDVSRMEWDMNTNVDAVFDLILQVLPTSFQGLGLTPIHLLSSPLRHVLSWDLI